MTGSATATALVEFDNVPGIHLVQSIGLKIMGIVLVAQLAYELYKVLKGGSPDLAGPIAKTAAGMMLVAAVPTVGAWISSLTLSLAATMQGGSQLELFGRSVATALGASNCDETGLTATLGLLFSPKGWIAMLSSVVFVAMYLCKFIVIDVLYPVCLSLVVFLGLISVPIGLFPGAKGIGGWVRNVIEVSLWPVVFQFLVAMLAATFPKIIAAMGNGEVQLDCGAGAVLGESAQAATGETGLIAFLKFMAICVVYVILLLFTPLLSAMVMRGAPVSVVGGIVAAKAGALMGSMVKATAMPVAGGLASSAMRSVGASGKWALGAMNKALSRSDAEKSLNER